MAGPGDPVSTFLKHVVPWANNTYVNIEAFEWVPKPGFPPEDGEGTISPRGSRAARDLNEAVNFARWQDGLGREVYIRMVSHRHPGAGKTDKRGRIYYRALGGAANAAEAKDFWIDVDVKPTGHGSPQLAQDAVRAMCAAIGLPEPAMYVYSGGGGFHAHWILPVAIPIEQWRPLARALAEACKAHGVHADHNLTVNTVCLLRIPGTHNRKYGVPRPVLLGPLNPAVPLDVFEKAVAPYLGLGTPASAGNNPQGTGSGIPDPAWDLSGFPTNRPPVKLEDAFLGGLTGNFSPYTLEEVAKGCPLVEKTLETGGAGQDNNLWFAVSHVALFTEGGVEDLVRLSDGHATYDRTETEALYARNLATKEATDQGWPRCQTLELAGSSWCSQCPNKTHNKSPFNFAVKDPVVTPPSNPPEAGESGDNPDTGPGDRKLEFVEGYVAHPVTGVYNYMEQKKNRKGETWDEEVKLCAYGLWNLDYKQDQHGKFAVHFDTRLAQQHWTHVIVPSDACADGTRLKVCLESYGLGIRSDETKELLNFMASFKSQMIDRLSVIHRQELMGWIDNKGVASAFIFGPTKFNCDGNSSFNQPNKWIRENYFPVGSIDPWLEAIRMLNAEKRPEMDLLAATAFAAPLMRFTGEKGVVISAYSSGTAAHKTTAIKVGQGTWGSFAAINQLTDTGNNVMARVGMTRVVPQYYDEMKASHDLKKLGEILFMVAGGRGKGRLNRNAEIRDVDTWDTLLVGVSNDSLFDYMMQHDKSTDASVARIFEFAVAPPDDNAVGQIGMGAAGKILKKLESNYGHAGMRFAELLGRSVNTLPNTIPEVVTILQNQLKAEPHERFWVAAAAVLLVGAQMANDINLARFDLGMMRDFIGQTFTNMRAARLSGNLDISKSASVVNVLAVYVNDNRRSLMATSTPGQAGRVAHANPVQILNPNEIHLVTQFNIRYIQSNNTLRLRKSAFSKWLVDRGMSPGVFFKSMDTLYGSTETSASITSGTMQLSAKERLIVLDLSHPDLIGLYP